MNHPTDYHPSLTDERLALIASALLDMRSQTKEDLSSEYDDNYSIESACFGRCRNKIIEMTSSDEYPWLTLSNGQMDVTFSIGGVECRFFRDSSTKPKKKGFFRPDQNLSLFKSDDSQPLIWRFIIEKSFSEEEDDRVYFIGYSLHNQELVRWEHNGLNAGVHLVAKKAPKAVELEAAPIDLLGDEALSTQEGQEGVKGKTGS